MIHKLGGRVGAVFFKSLYKAPSGILINGSVLEKLFSDHLAVFEAGRRNEFDIQLDALSGIDHLFVGFGDILWVGRMDGQDAQFAKEAVKPGDRAGIPTPPEFDPKNDETVMGITAPHILDEFDLLRGMLVRMVMGTPGAVAEGIPGTVKALFPAVDILTVGLVFNSRFCDAKSISIFNQG